MSKLDSKTQTAASVHPPPECKTSPGVWTIVFFRNALAVPSINEIDVKVQPSSVINPSQKSTCAKLTKLRPSFIYFMHFYIFMLYLFGPGFYLFQKRKFLMTVKNGASKSSEIIFEFKSKNCLKCARCRRKHFLELKIYAAFRLGNMGVWKPCRSDLGIV